MHEDKRYLATLFQKYLEGQVTEEEKKIIARWLVHLDLSGEPLTTAELQAKAELSRQALKERLAPDRIQTRSTFRFPFWLRSVAAVLLVGILIFFYRKQETSSVVPQQQVAKELLPGGSKAVLTLDDGSTINLTTVKNGELARQGNASVTKEEAGQVVYEAPGSNQQERSTLHFNTISTPRAGQYQVVLPDGTKAWLNAASYIRFPTAFDGYERQVEVGGEVYFEVQKNKDKPFKVTCAGQTLTVLGTHFNVNAYPEEGVVKTTLLEGSVKISNGASDVVLKPGQQAALRAGIHEILVSEAENPDEAIAWKNGFFQFEKADIRTIMNQISRWYDVDITFADHLPAQHYSGKISRNVNASKVLKVLELSGIHFNIEGRNIIVKP